MEYNSQAKYCSRVFRDVLDAGQNERIKVAEVDPRAKGFAQNPAFPLEAALSSQKEFSIDFDIHLSKPVYFPPTHAQSPDKNHQAQIERSPLVQVSENGLQQDRSRDEQRGLGLSTIAEVFGASHWIGRFLVFAHAGFYVARFFSGQRWAGESLHALRKRDEELHFYKCIGSLAHCSTQKAPRSVRLGSTGRRKMHRNLGRMILRPVLRTLHLSSTE